MLNNQPYKKFSELPYQVSKADIIKNGFRTSPSSQRNFKSVIGDLLENQVDYLFNGKEIGSDSYVVKSKYRFIKTGNIQNDLLADFSSVEYCKPNKNEVLLGNEILIAEDGGGDGLGESCLYVKDKDYTDYLCNGILALRIENEEKRNFIFGFLKSNHFKEFIDNNTPRASTLRHSNGISKKFLIPIFNEKNDNHKILSLMIKNLIDKENKIKLKNKKIDEYIKAELNITNSHIIESSKSLFIKNDFRCSANLYSTTFLAIYKALTTCSSYPLLTACKIFTGDTINKADYIPKNSKRKKILVQTKDINFNFCIQSNSVVTPNREYKSLPKKSFSLTRVGSPGQTAYIESLDIAVSDNQYILYSANELSIPTEVVAATCWWLKSTGYFNVIANKTNGGFLTHEILKKFIFIPSFTPDVQLSLKKIVSNQFAKNINRFDTYIDNEFERNEELGIWQLNMECFELKAKINKLVEKIVLNKKIHIPFYLK